MASKSSIEWTEATWNPIVGCSVVSPGCTNCYAMKMSGRINRMQPDGHYAGTVQDSRAGAVWTGKVALAPDRVIMTPLRRRKPTTYFVNSMGDLFHENVPDAWIDRVFAIMAVATERFQGAGDGYETVKNAWTASDGTRHSIRWPLMKSGPHTFQILTKRADRMRKYLAVRRHHIASAAYRMAHDKRDAGRLCDSIMDGRLWPLPNVWLGVSAEDQARAKERIPDLLATPAAIRFVSAEPLLGPVELDDLIVDDGKPGEWHVNALDSEGADPADDPDFGCNTLDWVICGGESGPGARPMHADWARSLRDQCAAAGVAFFMKQMSGPVKSRMPAIPDDLMVRQTPQAKD